MYFCWPLSSTPQPFKKRTHQTSESPTHQKKSCKRLTSYLDPSNHKRGIKQTETKMCIHFVRQPPIYTLLWVLMHARAARDHTPPPHALLPTFNHKSVPNPCSTHPSVHRPQTPIDSLCFSHPPPKRDGQSPRYSTGRGRRRRRRRRRSCIGYTPAPRKTERMLRQVGRRSRLKHPWRLVYRRATSRCFKG